MRSKPLQQKEDEARLKALFTVQKVSFPSSYKGLHFSVGPYLLQLVLGEKKC